MFHGRGRMLLAGSICVALAIAVFALRSGPGKPVASVDVAAQPADDRAVGQDNGSVTRPVSPGGHATPVAQEMPAPSTELQRAEARLEALSATAEPLTRLRATAAVIRRRCRMGPLDRTLQPPECLAGLDGRVATVVVAAETEREAFVAAVEQTFLDATEPAVMAGLMQLHGSHLSDSKPVLSRLEQLAAGTHPALAELAAQRLLAAAPAPDDPTRELAARLLRNGNGRAVPVVCAYVGRSQWSGDASHGPWIVGQILQRDMRAHARHCLVAALESLGATTQLATLVSRLGSDSPADLAVRAATQAALARLKVAPRLKP